MSSLFLLGQANELTLTTATNKRGPEITMTFTARNTSAERKVITLRLKGGIYGRADNSLPLVKTVGPGNTRVLSLGELKVRPGYSWNYFSGCLNTKPKDVTYLLPFAAGKTANIQLMHNAGEKYFDEAAPEGWAAFYMTAVTGDTVFAARRGKVVMVIEDMGVSEGQELSFSANYNLVVVEHEDCTRGTYKMFDKDGVFPEVGASVEAGDPLGTITDGSNYGTGSHLLFYVSYPKFDRKLLLSSTNYRAIELENGYVNPKFVNLGVLQNRGNYTAEHPEAVILQEMSKRQIKNWLKRKEGYFLNK